MKQDALASWEVVRELGIEYHSPPHEPGSVTLWSPAVVERAADGARLVVDELATERGLPVRHECRTLLLSPSGEIIFDSVAQGLHDGYGCLVDAAQIAILRRTTWEILICLHGGEVVRRIDLARVSKLPPRIMCWTGHSFLLVFLSASHVLDIVEIDDAGRPCWYLPQALKPRIGVPGSVQLLPGGSLLIADEFHHVVHEVARDGSAQVRWGDWANPGADLLRLSAPKCARQSADGTLLIADTHNHRLLAIDPETGPKEIALRHHCPVAPSFVAAAGDGLVVCDAGNRTAFELDARGEVVWSLGAPPVRNRLFSFPRSVQHLEGGRYLVADTAGNRVVEMSAAELRPLPFHGETPLFWPRAAQRTPTGTTLVADGRNSRVLEISSDGLVMLDLKQLKYGNEAISLDDPHDVRAMPDGTLLITDAAQDVVLEVDREGQVRWLIGRDEALRLRDPHSAQPLGDGRIVIADSSNHRVLFFNPASGGWHALTEVRGPTSIFRLHLPRYAEVSGDGTLVIADTGNHRLLASSLAGEFLWELTGVPNSPIAGFLYPRWASAISRDEVIVSDHFHHRVVHLRRV